MAVTPPKGTHDIIAAEALAYDYIESVCQHVASNYGFDPIRTPIFESTDLFSRGVGESSDIVNKEMYTFLDKGQRSISLRPENTAGVARSVISNKLYATADLPLKFSYNGPMFRYERPQLGRFRQFHQFGVENIGASTIYDDLETIMLAYNTLQLLGFKNLVLKINSLGDQITRNNYKSALKTFFGEKIDSMCSDCHTRYKTNPLRILDCKVPMDQELVKFAPSINQYLSENSKDEFEFIKNELNEFKIPYIVDEKLVRGLDYYSGIIFEFHYITSDGKDYGAIGGGGHYDRLVNQLGGPALEGVGFAFGIERLYSILRDENLLQEELIDNSCDAYIMTFGKKPREAGFELANRLRMFDFRVKINFEDKPFKSLFKIAERTKSKYALIIGDNELEQGFITVKDLTTKEQVEIGVEEIVDFLEGRIVR